jgi:TRAP transporter TAXI family solute receptor
MKEILFVITLGTATPGGGFPVYGAAFADMVNAQKPMLRVEPRNTKGSAENVPLLETSKVDLALVAGEFASAALTKPGSTLRIVTAMYASPGMVMVKADSPYRTLADLKGKRVVLGAGASGITAMGHTVFDALGIPVEKILLEKVADGPAMFLDGRADAIWGAGVGWPAFTALAKQGGRFIGPSADEIQRILARQPALQRVTLPADSYPGQTAALPSVGSWSFVLCNEDLSSEKAYLLASAIHRAESPLAARLAQAWPSRPIRLVVPYAPGGSADLLSRTVAVKLGEAIGQQVLVDNRAGAAGTLGADLVAKSAPDGYTLLLGTGQTHGLAQLLSRTPPYDLIKDFTPITAAAEVPIVIVTHPSVPASNAMELVEWEKKNPGKLSYGTPGTGSPHHLSGEFLKQVAGIDWVHVAYKGAAPAVQDAVGNQIPAAISKLSTALPHVKSGKLRALGLVEAKRQPSAPEIPTVGESIAGHAMPRSWLGFFAPAGLPEAILVRCNAEINKAAQSPDVRARLEAAGIVIAGTTSAEFARMIRDDIEIFRRIIGSAGIKPE